MPRKYIKDKNGKFQGSLPDAKELPKATPPLPKQSNIELVSGFDKNGKYVIRETEESQRRFRQLQARLGL